jgi:hypothetical protein
MTYRHHVTISDCSGRQDNLFWPAHISSIFSLQLTLDKLDKPNVRLMTSLDKLSMYLEPPMDPENPDVALY